LIKQLQALNRVALMQEKVNIFMTEGMRDEEMRALYKKSTEESQIRQKKV